MISLLSNLRIPVYIRHYLFRVHVSCLLALALTLASHHCVFAATQSVPEENMLQLKWISQGVYAHHYVLTVEQTSVSGGTETETMSYYTNSNSYALDVLDGFSYSVRIQSVDPYGNKSEYSDATVFTVENMQIVEKRSAVDLEVPIAFSLYPNYPNPFNPVTNIRFDLPRESKVQLIVYSITGQKVAELVNNQLTAGNHSIVWDAAGLSSGTYICRIVAGEFSQTRKMLLLK